MHGRPTLATWRWPRRRERIPIAGDVPRIEAVEARRRACDLLVYEAQRHVTSDLGLAERVAARIARAAPAGTSGAWTHPDPAGEGGLLSDHPGEAWLRVLGS